MVKSLALQTQIDIPTRNFGVNTFGPFTSPTLPAGVDQFVVVLTPDAPTWPTSGIVVQMTVEESADGGSTWRPANASDFGSVLPHDRAGNIVPSWIWTTGLSPGTQKIRFSANVLQACRAAVSLGVQ